MGGEKILDSGYDVIGGGQMDARSIQRKCIEKLTPSSSAGSVPVSGGRSLGFSFQPINKLICLALRRAANRRSFNRRAGLLELGFSSTSSISWS